MIIVLDQSQFFKKLIKWLLSCGDLFSTTGNYSWKKRIMCIILGLKYIFFIQKVFRVDSYNYNILERVLNLIIDKRVNNEIILDNEI